MSRTSSIKYSKLLITIGVISAMVFQWRCAAIGPPSGGPKDETPPVLLSALPETGAVNYAGDPIILHFSEYLAEESVEKAVHVYPRLPDPVVVQFKGTDLIIHWPDSLSEDQTYILTISRSLTDEHKVKLAETIQLAYSTGDYVDDGTISGRVYGSPECVVHLWKIAKGETFDSVLFRLPDYVTEINEDGYYSFQYLSPGRYQACALGSENSGRELVPDKMLYGLLWKEEIQLDTGDAITGMNIIPAFEPQPLRVTKGEWVSPTWGRISFSAPYSVRNTQPYVSFYIGDSLLDLNVLLYDDPNSAETIIVQTDSLPTDEECNVLVVRPDASEQFNSDSTWLTLQIPEDRDTTDLLLLTPAANTSLKPQLENQPSLTLEFSQPVILGSQPDSSISLLLEDSIQVQYRVLPISPMVYNLEMSQPWVENKKYTLSLDSSVVGINGKGFSRKREVRKIATTHRQGYGGLLGSVTSSSRYNLITRLEGVEKSKKVYYSSVNSTSEYQFELIPDGQYILMIFDDIDSNLVYTTGKARPYRAAEWFSILADTIEIRANWEFELDSIDVEEIK